MGVYIHNMEMPRNCLACDWCAHTIPADNYICYRLNRAVIGVAKEDVNETVNACCPLVPVPPHGDLIDRREAIIDANERAYDFWLSDDEVNATIQFLNEQTTIIPAEEGET